MLERSHRRLEDRLVELVAAAGDWRRRRDADALSICRDVCHFLERAAARHERDEEDSVFPRLPRSPLIDGLAADHRAHEKLTAELSRRLAAGAPDPDALVRLAAELERRYRDHIEREERDLFPLIESLPPADRDAAFDEMQSRRGR